ncbi:cytochrome P450 124 [Mycobacteroides abscessus subsp. bolletii]|uniref:cytochrome P450 n=1 Tax=Mycobacteroides abscessus TaxID=36809 RepID=UPI0002ECDF05|nr:cytochrome P450 [Mycobacteroides abscessus]SHO90352.1 cytochrome P450 124 [Mycobacteroides abscessus subsp. abscessus]SHZ22443.1 cytochrome P450 124 [Mycobacteroides abscessus subsp. bolletii]SIE27244.1 cytochrome P450 124 [Mycobacteroides abscessus subsp. abscessus]SIH99867.1 cytochrome P450 124 [Mycobacteroides abscessus subsp. abscessus]SKQ00486.1 cytochrome P450 124 [Mycobacteroides abscessus subsp. bolletii]
MTVQTQNPSRTFDPVSISPVSFWAMTNEEREPSFKILRDERPVSWHPPIEGALIAPEVDGVWAVTRHEDIAYVSKNPELFCSGEGVMIEALPEDVLEAVMSFLAMDGTQHSSTRRLISSVFTPRQIAKIKDQIEHQAVTIVDDLLKTKEGDFVEQVSKRLPMWTIYEMIGLAPEKREQGADLADAIMGWNDADVAAGREPGQLLVDTLVGLLELSLELTEERRAHPQDDLASLLVQAEIDGRRLTDEEIAAFFVLLSVAGNDTTRNTVSFTTMAFQQFPQQRALLEQDFDGHIKLAMDEFVRWASPISTFRRTATQDTELKGIEIKKGDWVVMMYGSGNRDERVFDNPHVFDITRTHNPHVAFGGGGPHYCMGAFLAKMQLEALYRQLIFRAPALRVGEPTYMTSNFVRAVKSLPYTLI